MEFQVSARKWRPQKFSELIGQEHIVRTLVNAIELERISHAYLFSGTRGVGKTTTARILAKALNCLDRSSIEPCDACAPCMEIRQGNSLDVQEIDGASNNGVAEVRDLIENVQYATSSCRYKVYIIDEVHMLSKSAFNALLKTLEEPPPRVIFIFATTELIKIPETILSRCQCFEFKPLSHKQIIDQLELICRQEGIDADRKSLEEIAKNGSGSMRDAQSLLDQVIAFCGKQVAHGSVESVLGIVGQKALETFVDHLTARDLPALIEQIQQVVHAGKDLNYFCRDLVETIRHLLMVKVARNPESILDSSTCDIAMLKKQAEAFDPDELQQMFTVLSRAEMDMKRSPHSRFVFEMAVLRLADVRPFGKIDALIDAINRMEPEAPAQQPWPAVAVRKPQAAGEKISEALPDPEPQTQAVAHPEKTAGGAGTAKAQWERIKKEIAKRKASFGHYLMVCDLIELTDSEIHLGVNDAYTKELIETEDKLQAIREGVKAVLNRDVKVKLSLKTAVAEIPPSPGEDPEVKKKTPKDTNGAKGAIAESEIVQEALDIFGGMVIR